MVWYFTTNSDSDSSGENSASKTTAKAPIPLGVVILTLIATPILTLRMVRK